jgi:hypothetical protein
LRTQGFERWEGNVGTDVNGGGAAGAVGSGPAAFADEVAPDPSVSRLEPLGVHASVASTAAMINVHPFVP